MIIHTSAHYVIKNLNRYLIRLHFSITHYFIHYLVIQLLNSLSSFVNTFIYLLIYFLMNIDTIVIINSLFE